MCISFHMIIVTVVVNDTDERVEWEERRDNCRRAHAREKE